MLGIEFCFSGILGPSAHCLESPLCLTQAKVAACCGSFRLKTVPLILEELGVQGNTKDITNLRTEPAMLEASSDGLSALNVLPESSFRAVLHACCASASYVDGMLSHRPFGSEDALFEASHAVWNSLSKSDWLEAFAAHPRIGGVNKAGGDADKFATWSRGEQAGVADASERAKVELARMNDEYFEKHRFVFLICATGKSAEKMRDRLKERLENETEKEVEEAAKEQIKITDIRLRKVLDEAVHGGS